MGDRRFLVALMLVMGVVIGTNMLFPPVVPDPAESADSTATADSGTADSGTADSGAADPGATTDPGATDPLPGLPAVPSLDSNAVDPGALDPDAAVADGQADGRPTDAQTIPVRDIVVEGPLYRFTFTNLGGRLTSARMLQFPSFQRDGSVELVPEGGEPLFGSRVLIGQDTLDLRGVAFEVIPEGGLQLSGGSGPQELTFRYNHPTADLGFEITYTFDPDSYVVGATGRQRGMDRGLLVTDMGSGIAFNELKEKDDLQFLAYVTNGDEAGIRATALSKAEGPQVLDGPFRWAAFKSKYFVSAAVAGDESNPDARFGGVLLGPVPVENQIPLAVTQGFATDGSFGFRAYMGPQDLAGLASLGENLENVNPYGWRFLRPIIRPFSGLITAMLIWLHQRLDLAYGWVLIMFGVMMRAVMFIPHHRATKAQLRNMEVQPKLKAIQEKHKDNPERLQKEMVKLYKEDGFNPFAGCLPMLLPWPVLIALFFVFQNSIELRGVPFWWLPDLSAPDPYYILPVFLGVSMFLVQWIGFRSVKDMNPQMKMMMWFMPLFMMILFMNFASGLNLYYSMANVAMLPQQWFISKERMKAHEKAAARKEASEASESSDEAEPVPVPDTDPPSGTPGSQKSKAGARSGSASRNRSKRRRKGTKKRR